MIAIHTKFIPANDSRGSRIKAYTAASKFSALIPVDHSLGFEARHFEAVKALIKKHDLDWDIANMRYGDSADGKGYVFCFANSTINEG